MSARHDKNEPFVIVTSEEEWSARLQEKAAKAHKDPFYKPWGDHGA